MAPSRLTLVIFALKNVLDIMASGRISQAKAELEKVVRQLEDWSK